MSGIFIGLDVGSVSVKLAALAVENPAADLAERIASSATFRAVSSAIGEPAGASLVISDYRRALGNPRQTAQDLLAEFRALFPGQDFGGIRVTGSGGSRVAADLGVCAENEFKAIARAFAAVHPEVRTVLEMGGESSKYLRVDFRGGNGTGQARSRLGQPLGILDYATSGECAAGTGSFIDQQASRLQYRVEEIGAVVENAKCAARIAGRCSVFAKSDMIHAQQKGYGTGEVLKGLCEAVARNFKSNIVRGKPVAAPVAFIGAVSQNSGVVAALGEAFRLGPGDLMVPELYAWMGAIGAALLERDDAQRRPPAPRLSAEQSVAAASAGPAVPYAPLSLENVLLLRDHPEATRTEPLPPLGTGRLTAYLGIDIGSVSTNLAVLDDQGRLLHSIYLRTVGRPIEVVHQGLQEIEQLFGPRIKICGAGTTGSGRELIGELVGADTVNDEITAHKTGAVYVYENLVRNRIAGFEGSDAPGVDTIFEIGGQDAKFISIDRGVVVDFAMNEACAAGTGSFLEEQAERLGIQIKDEFAALALSSTTPARLGERCTVFMERDVTGLLHRGAEVRDLSAGLAYAVALNYLNRVVRGRRIGNVIYFQGGTAYNDAVAAAFSMILGKRIIVPPYNGVIGAIGMALIARDVVKARSNGHARSSTSGVPAGNPIESPSSRSSFRGYDLYATHFRTREFVCKACSNYCDMKEITVDGQKTYWGDKCSDKFRKRARTDRRPVLEDLFAVREKALRGDYEGAEAAILSGQRRVGIPQAMYYFDRFPFWRKYLEGAGFAVVVSEPTDRQIAARGVELCASEPCFPVQIAHGHVQSLFEGKSGVDFVLLPNVIDVEASPGTAVATYLCPWNQTLPFVVRAAPALAPRSGAILAPTVYFRLGPKHIKRQLAEYFERFGVSRRRSDAAVEAGYAAQAEFTRKLLEAGQEACRALEQTGEPAILLVGRPYNLYDRNANCDIPRKLRDLYGVNVLPFDFLPVDDEQVEKVHPDMYWNSGRRILAAGLLAQRLPNAHIIYITNFKCGPDSFIKHFLSESHGAPFLVLQFDSHSNDAGYLTRCEAYLDSKRILRCSSATKAS